MSADTIPHLRGRVASLSRSREPGDPEFQTARQELRAAVLAKHIKKVVDAAPPLTPEQLSRLAAILKAAS